MLKKRCVLLLFSFLLCNANAQVEVIEDTGNYSNDSSKVSKEELEYRFNKSYLKLFEDKNMKQFRKTRLKKDYLEKEMLNLNELNISANEEVQLLKKITFIVMHPELPRTLIFPKNYKINNVIPIPNDVNVVYDELKGHNTIDILPTVDLKKTTLLIKYKKDNKKGQMTVFIENHINTKIKEKSTLYLITNFQEPKTIKPIKVLMAYKKKNNNRNPRSGSFIQIGKIKYTFIEDNINGKMTINNKKFYIKSSYEGIN